MYLNKLTVITGNSFPDGTRRLEEYIKKYNSDDVLYFPRNRKLIVSKDEMEAFDILCKLNNHSTLKERIEESYDMQDPFAYADWEKLGHITCGYLEIMNYYYGILCNPKPNLVVVIDHFDMRLHELLRNSVLMDLHRIVKVKEIIVTSYSERLLGFFEQCNINNKQRSVN